MGLIWRSLKWTAMALGVYYVYQNFVKPELGTGTTTTPATMTYSSPSSVPTSDIPPT